MFYGLLQLYKLRPQNSFFKWYYIQQLDVAIGSPTFVAITFLFTDLINNVSPNRPAREMTHSVPPQPQEKITPYQVHSSETPASSHKDMLSEPDNEGTPVTKSQFRRPAKLLSTANSNPKTTENKTQIFTNTGMPLQLPRRDSQISLRSHESKCFTTVMLSLLIVLCISEIQSIGVFAALLTSLLQRAFSDKEDRICGHIRFIFCLDRVLGNRRLCGVGFFPGNDLHNNSGKREISVDLEYEQISVQSRELQNTRMIGNQNFSSPQKKIKRHFGQEDTEDTQDQRTTISMHIDRKALYQRQAYYYNYYYLNECYSHI